MTKWLTKEQQHVWRLWLEVTQRQTQAIDDDLQATSDLTLSDYEILVTLSESPDHEARMSELADRAIISRSRLTYRVDRMVKKGFVVRMDAGTDRRGVIAKLTEEGMRHLVVAAPQHVDKVQQLLFEHLDSDELKALSSILDKLVDCVRD